jgi:mono/diheme cytochrome c family protein
MKMKATRSLRAFLVFAAVLFAGFAVMSGGHRAAVTVVSAQDATGAQLFARNCARCHGPDGKGDSGPNLTSEKRKAKWRDSSQPIANKITKGGFIMPSFKKKLTPAQITAIADHVRSLK